jgi:outer membrane protein assembly factor BamB
MKIPVIFCPECDHLIWEALECENCRWHRSYDDLGLGELCWERKIDRKIGRGPSSLVAVGDCVVMCNHRGGLIALDATDGSRLWSQRKYLLSDTIISGLAVWQDRVLVTLRDTSDPDTPSRTKMVILDPQTGEELGEFAISASSLSVPVVEDDIAFFTAAMKDGPVAFALDLNTCRVCWRERISNWDQCPPLIIDRFVWFGLGTPVLQGFPLSGLPDGGKLRELHPGDTALFVAVGQYDDIFVVSDDWMIYQVDVRTDTILCACSQAHKYTSPPSIGEGTLYIGALGKRNRKPGFHKYAIAPQEIRYLQSFSLEKQVSQPPLLCDDAVIAVDDAGNLEIIGQRTGERYQQVATHLRICTRPVVQGDLVFLAGRDGEVQARYWRHPKQLPESPLFYEQNEEWRMAGIAYTLDENWYDANRCFIRAGLRKRATFIKQFNSYERINENRMNPECFIGDEDAISLVRALILFGRDIDTRRERKNILVVAGIEYDFIDDLSSSIGCGARSLANDLVSNFKSYKVSENRLDYHPMVQFLNYLLEMGPEKYGLDDDGADVCKKLAERGEENLKALKSRSSVGRIESPHGIGIGTGVLIGKSFLLTCNHVLSRCQNQPAYVRFRCKSDTYALGKYVFELDIQPIEASSQPDYAVVKVKGTPPQQIARPVNKTLSGGLDVRVIHYPKGRHVVVSNVGQIVQVGNEYIAHTLTTAEGSSGAPIFDRDWDLVALHRGEPSLGGSLPEGSTMGVPLHAIWDEISSYLD